MYVIYTLETSFFYCLQALAKALQKAASSSGGLNYSNVQKILGISEETTSGSEFQAASQSTSGNIVKFLRVIFTTSIDCKSFDQYSSFLFYFSWHLIPIHLLQRESLS